MVGPDPLSPFQVPQLPPPTAAVGFSGSYALASGSQKALRDGAFSASSDEEGIHVGSAVSRPGWPLLDTLSFCRVMGDWDPCCLLKASLTLCTPPSFHQAPFSASHPPLIIAYQVYGLPALAKDLTTLLLEAGLCFHLLFFIVCLCFWTLVWLFPWDEPLKVK